MTHSMIAPCGIDCSACDIHRAKDNPELMAEVLDWFKTERKKEFSAEQIRCDGCLGERSRHWSPECWILRCVVEEHHHESCSECEEFPCERLEKWGRSSAGYSKALARLKAMRAGKR